MAARKRETRSFRKKMMLTEMKSKTWYAAFKTLWCLLEDTDTPCTRDFSSVLRKLDNPAAPLFPAVTVGKSHGFSWDVQIQLGSSEAGTGHPGWGPSPRFAGLMHLAPWLGELLAVAPIICSIFLGKCLALMVAKFVFQKVGIQTGSPLKAHI